MLQFICFLQKIQYENVMSGCLSTYFNHSNITDQNYIHPTTLTTLSVNPQKTTKFHQYILNSFRDGTYKQKDKSHISHNAFTLCMPCT